MKPILLLAALALIGCDAWYVSDPGTPCAFVDRASRTLIKGHVTDSVIVAIVGRGDGSGRDTLWAVVCQS